jgi:hypothetical protein
MGPGVSWTEVLLERRPGDRVHCWLPGKAGAGSPRQSRGGADGSAIQPTPLRLETPGAWQGERPRGDGLDEVLVTITVAQSFSPRRSSR